MTDPHQPGYPPSGAGQAQQYPPPGQQYPPPGGQQYPPPQPQGGGAPPQTQWMARPNISNCPPGLEYLSQVDQLLVQQQVEILEVITSWETKNKYVVRNSMGQQVYFAAEESDMCMRQCCGPQREFTMHITDNMGQEVIRVYRQFKCCAGCCWCACSECGAQELTVEAPPGQVVGHIRQKCSFLQPQFELFDANNKSIFHIHGPMCICQGPCCTWDQEFEVLSSDMQHKVGKVSKQWSGLVREMFTDADNFGVNFPMDLDVKLKATLLGVVFLIDFMYFENQQNNNN